MAFSMFHLRQAGKLMGYQRHQFRHGSVLLGWGNPSFAMISFGDSTHKFGKRRPETLLPHGSMQVISWRWHSSGGRPGEGFIWNDQPLSTLLQAYTERRQGMTTWERSVVWNSLARALQNQRRLDKRQLWKDTAGWKFLLGDTLASTKRLNARSTATIAHRLAKIMSATNIPLSHVETLWNSLQHRIASHVRSEKFKSMEIASIVWALAKVHTGRVPKSTAFLLEGLATAAIAKFQDSSTPQDLANTAWAYATLGCNNPPLFHAIALAAAPQIDGFNAQELANTAWAFATLNIPNPKLMDTIAVAAVSKMGDFIPQSLANTAWAYGTLGHRHPALLDAIATASATQIAGFSPQGLSNTAWAYATLHHEAPALLDAIAVTAVSKIGDCAPQALANMAWAYGTVGYKNPALLDAIAASAVAKISGFTPQGLANTAWAYATLDYEAPSLFDAISGAAVSRIEGFNPQALSNMVWAYATLKYEKGPLLDVIAAASVSKMGQFKAQELANTAWAYATLKYEAPKLLDAIAATAVSKIEDFKPQNLANLAWAYATLNYEAPMLLDAIAATAVSKIVEFKPQNLSNTAWAYAILKIKSPVLMDAIATTAVTQIGDFNPQELANTSWAFATLNHKDQALLDSTSAAGVSKIGDFKPQELASIAWAYAYLNCEVTPLLDAIAAAAISKIEHFKSKELANMAWAYAVFDSQAEVFMGESSPVVRALMVRDRSDFGLENLCQLHQFELWCKERANDISFSGWFPNDLSLLCQEAFLSTQSTTSNFQEQVVSILRTIDQVTDIQEEFATCSGYRLDASLRYRGHPVAIEVDGPSHFVGQSQQPKGGTVLKRRQLQRLEERILVSVPYWEWNKEKGSNKKHEYLQTLLDKALLMHGLPSVIEPKSVA